MNPTVLSSSLRALAYLRSAWFAADKHDRPFVTMALKDLLAAPTVHVHRDDALRVLRQGVTEEEIAELFGDLWPQPWKK